MELPCDTVGYFSLFVKSQRSVNVKATALLSRHCAINGCLETPPWLHDRKKTWAVCSTDCQLVDSLSEQSVTVVRGNNTSGRGPEGRACSSTSETITPQDCLREGYSPRSSLAPAACAACVLRTDVVMEILNNVGVFLPHCTFRMGAVLLLP